MLSRREILAAGASIVVAGACGVAKRQAAIAPTSKRSAIGPQHLPRWRGFNLWEKLTPEVDGPYLEWDFDRIAEWGFDFVRLPTDYRIWTSSSGHYRERPLREIDQAIAWGRARRIHVCLALAVAPGYGVDALKLRGPLDALDLWADGDEARRQFAAQWRMLAERYRGIDSADLSFNLVNEPPKITGAQYLRTARAAVDAIRAVDVERLVIADGSSWGREPVGDLVPLAVAQSTRGYMPFELSTYKADWMEGSAEWPEPVWPIPPSLNSHLYGPWKKDLKRPLVLRGDFASGPIAITVAHVSAKATLVVLADGVEVLRHAFEPGPGAGEWKDSKLITQYQIYSATYDKRYAGALAKAAREIRIEVEEGDWLTFTKLEIGGLVLVARDVEWGVVQGEYAVDASGVLHPDESLARLDGALLFTKHVEPWVRFAHDARVGVHVGEWGVHHHTPHAVALAWMRDCLTSWRRARFGWALWNLRGSFGVLDSDRKDVIYEPYKGHRLDRRMLDVLREDLST